MLTPAEEKILKKIAERNIITKFELKEFLRTNGGSENVTSLVDTVCRSLIGKSLISPINPVGSTCYIITQRGAKMINEMA